MFNRDLGFNWCLYVGFFDQSIRISKLSICSIHLFFKCIKIGLGPIHHFFRHKIIFKKLFSSLEIQLFVYKQCTESCNFCFCLRELEIIFFRINLGQNITSFYLIPNISNNLNHTSRYFHCQARRRFTVNESH